MLPPFRHWFLEAWCCPLLRVVPEILPSGTGIMLAHMTSSVTPCILFYLLMAVMASRHSLCTSSVSAVSEWIEKMAGIMITPIYLDLSRFAQWMISTMFPSIYRHNVGQIGPNPSRWGWRWRVAIRNDLTVFKLDSYAGDSTWNPRKFHKWTHLNFKEHQSGINHG